MSCCRKNSVRDKVTGKKCIWSERYTSHRQCVVWLQRQEQPQAMGSSGKLGAAEGETCSTDSMGHFRRQEAPKYRVLAFSGLGNFIS